MSGILLASVGNSYGSAPVNTVAPVVSGTATIGQTLSTTNGTWTGAPAPTFTYQWQRVTTNISGATSSTYVLVAADVGNTIRCVVKATNTIAPSGVTANSNSTASVAAIVPGAPTIGTATATNNTTATVDYTAPVSDGGATITSYTATSSPSGITGTLSQAGSGTITISGLTLGTPYTFTVTATNSAGTSAASAASNSVTPAFIIGMAYEGGYYAGQYSSSGNGIANYNLVIAPYSTGRSILAWKNAMSATPGADSNSNGTQNTADMVADGNATVYPCAHFCNNLSTGGQTDWYMPAKNELEVCFYNLRPYSPNVVPNNTGSGVNPNAVPARASTYDALGPPNQTTATIFQISNSESFGNIGYWTSTEYSVNYAGTQDFASGNQSYYFKNK